MGHYTQIINENVGMVGCGAAIKGKNIIACCNYSPGQYNTKTPYTKGTPCSECSSQNCKNNVCYCDKYCQNYGTLDLKTCTCKCKPYAFGPNCEFKTCNNTDKAYGCWGSDKAYCGYSNTVGDCPHLCGICDYV